MLLILTIILIILILLVCGDKGSRAIVTTTADIILLLIALFLIYRGCNTVLVTVATCISITAIILFYQNEADIKSKVAFISVVTVIVILIPLVYLIATGSNTQGFNTEQYGITDSEGYTRNINLNMISMQISVMIIALIGTVTDTAVAITSSVYELRQSNDNLTISEILNSAFKVGRAVLNSSIHTIFYIYIAEYMTLIIQYADSKYSFLSLINSKSFCHEILSVSVSGLGCCLVVPVATILGTLIIKTERLQSS